MEPIIISSEEIADYLYKKLVEDGYAPSSDEILDLADYVFEFFIDFGIVDEEWEDEE